MFKYYVKWFGKGGLLSCDGFNSLSDAKKYISDTVMPLFEPGDAIELDEVE